jgi:hypothetical protein
MIYLFFALQLYLIIFVQENNSVLTVFPCWNWKLEKEALRVALALASTFSLRLFAFIYNL